MKKENIALIGYGYWGKKIYRYLKESDRFNLSCVYFPSLKNYDDAAIVQRFGEEFVSDINRIWTDPKIPNVVIASPIDTHFEMTSCALTHSKNVLVEKPLVIKIEEAILLEKTAQERNLILETEYTYTYSRGLEHAKSLIDDGMIGKVQSMFISLKQLGRFLPYDVYLLLGSHALSILDIFIPLNELEFSSSNIMITNKIVTSAIVQFESEKMQCRGHIDIDLHYPGRDRKVAMYGEKGTIIYNPEEKDALRLALYERAPSSSERSFVERDESFQFDENHNLRNGLDNFYRLIQGTGPGCNIRRSVMVNSVLESLRMNRNPGLPAGMER